MPNDVPVIPVIRSSIADALSPSVIPVAPAFNARIRLLATGPMAPTEKPPLVSPVPWSRAARSCRWYGSA
jgi:hypothetical protein